MTRRIRGVVLEGLILDALKHNLMHPDFVGEFIREFHAEMNRKRRDAEVAINFKRRELVDLADRPLEDATRMEVCWTIAGLCARAGAR